MKKLAVAIGLILATQAVDAAEVYNKDGNKLDFYGSARARHYFSYDSAGTDGDQSYVRFGFKGQTQITKQLVGYGQWEYNVQANNSEGSGDATKGTKTRLGFAGLKFDNYGSLDYGRNWGIAYDVLVVTDTAPIFDELSISAPDNYMNGRGNGLLTYRNTNFFGLVNGLNFGLQYQGKNAADSNNGTGRSVTSTNGDGFGLSSSYTFGKSGITLLGTYTNADRTLEQESRPPQGTITRGFGGKAEMWATGLKYDANNVYLATMYGETHNMTPVTGGVANKTQNFEVVGQYLFDFGLRPHISYMQSKAKDLEVLRVNGQDIGGDADLLKYIEVGATYFFNKNMNVYADYKINLLDADNYSATKHTSTIGKDADNKFGVGLTYQF